MDDLALRVPQLRKDEINSLAGIGALNSLDRGALRPHRRDALWQAQRAILPVGPLLETLEEKGRAFPAGSMNTEKRLWADYRGTGLTIGRHPGGHHGNPRRDRLFGMRFYTWLMKNRWRADPIGDLAREVHSDSNWPKRANTWVDVRSALPHSACDGARSALRAAWNEYELYVGGPSHLSENTWVWGVVGNIGLKPPKRRGEESQEESAATFQL